MSDDSRLQKSVLAELDWEPSVTAAHIGVAAEDGVVTLTGHVASYPEKFAAESAARGVKGVRAVAEELEVRLPYGLKRNDDEIAKAAVEHLAWDQAVPPDAIKVAVEKGWITLSGEVPWNFQKEAAERDVRGLSGVIGLTNHTKIKPKVDVADVSDQIMHALDRSWFFDERTVSVTAADGKVHLSGTVRSWHERNVAATTAWSAPGVIAVVNDITVA
ncbi:BON domain-containing protein [Siculibacillus lacustris]|uniref:BON domain-containing protein n=1 Tax=Siculibacillus lacustris TaxID=1549641 RepID=A0A4Q9VNQ2_9HYPH|nr:BON domain-containing protein [Siculibacillus lacustris]TBW36788.1 BON domain-containing protein [Siculibacillus lacustris]